MNTTKHKNNEVRVVGIYKRIKRDTKLVYLCLSSPKSNLEYLMMSEITYILHIEREVFTLSIHHLSLPSLLCSAVEKYDKEW